MMSLALKKGIEDHLNKLITQPHFAIDIKWPNDLLVEGKKIAGILIENVITGDRPHLIVGIGLNTSTGEEDFISADVKISAASLKRFFPVTLNHTELLKDIIIIIDNMYNNLKAEDIVSEYRENIRFSGKYCRLELPEGVVEGICQGISDRGELIISNSDGQKKYLSGTLDLKF
jgi:BirA family biotin operon repressor/biotin-[acetyl-CoA-carboxylase] ligase